MKKEKLHYGWIVFGVCFLMVFVTLGFCSSVRSLYLAPVTKDTGIPRSLFSLNDVCRYAVVTTVNIFFGKIVGKFGARRLIGAGFIFLAASQFVYSLSTNLLMFCLGGILLGCGLAFTTTAIVGYVVEKWFTNSKGTIMGIILAANGLGGATASQILAPVIEAGASGWRNAYRLSAFIVLAVGLIVVFLIRNDPKDKNVEPMGKDGKSKTRVVNDWEGREFADVKKKGFFWATIFCCFMIGFIIQSSSSSSTAHLRDVGIDPVIIANVLSFHMIALFLSKMGTGFLFDRFGLRFVVSLCGICATAGIIILALSNSETTAGAYVYGVVSSIGLPLETIVMPLLAREMFGLKAYASVMGICVGVVQAGSMIASPLVNLYYDLVGSYRGIYIICGIVFAGVVILLNVLITIAHKDRKAYKAERRAQRA
ncbi:MAG: MFS transporter [Eubacteriales bacterium]|nr:MFS transporter [Eubacteriales bacterium]